MRAVQNTPEQLIDTRVAICTIDSPVGTLLAAATDQSLVALEFTESDTLAARQQALTRRFAAHPDAGQPLLVQLRSELDEYFAGRRRDFQLPLDYAGTAFQRSVWQLLLQIPYGITWSYRDMAERLGDLKALRAVGGANGANPIAILVPCHRVINASGALGGYGGGPWRKQLLLDLERGQHRLGF